MSLSASNAAVTNFLTTKGNMMKIYIAGLIASLSFISTLATARVTMEDVNRDTNALNRDILLNQDSLKAQGDKEWQVYNQTPITSGSSAINWSQMPAGSHCGSFIERSNGSSSSQSCMGYYNECPSGFTYASSGSIGGGQARIGTCIKN